MARAQLPTVIASEAKQSIFVRSAVCLRSLGEIAIAENEAMQSPQVASQLSDNLTTLDCFASLAMTGWGLRSSLDATSNR